MEGRSGKCVLGAELYLDPKQDSQCTCHVAPRSVRPVTAELSHALRTDGR